MQSDVLSKVDFSCVRYSQCWEDAEVLLAGLRVRPGDACVSIASAGDNTLALLLGDPGKVVAVDVSRAQLACLELRVAAFRNLEYEELLAFLGARPCSYRLALFARCQADLSPAASAFWAAHPRWIARGIINIGRFETYLRQFRRYVLPLIHNRQVRQRLLTPRTPAGRRRFYDEVWDNRRWRMLFRLFFSQELLGRLGRDPRFFVYAELDCPQHLLRRTRYALVHLDPPTNPYLQWIVTGRYMSAPPLYLQPEIVRTIRDRLDRLSWVCTSLETFLAGQPARSFDCFNLSDVFEYMSLEQTEALYREILRVGRPRARLVYWNLFARRERPQSLAHLIRPDAALAARLHARDRAFFYSRVVVEELNEQD